MSNLTTVLLLIVFTFGALYLVASEFLDIIGRIEMIEQKWPTAYEAMSNRPMRIILLVFLLGLVGKDLQDRAGNRVPALVVTMPPIPAPIITTTTNTERSLRLAAPTAQTAKTSVHASSSTATKAPELSPKILPSPALQQPQNPVAFPRPVYPTMPQEPLMYGATPYAEVEYATRQLQMVQQQFAYGLGEAERPYSFRSTGRPLETLPDELIQKYLEVDELSTNQYDKAAKSFEHIRSVSLKIIKMTPNQENRDNAEFTSADQSARKRATVAELRAKNTNGNRYMKIISYFNNLQKQVGDLHQP